jgi:hypothetical protein
VSDKLQKSLGVLSEKRVFNDFNTGVGSQKIVFVTPSLQKNGGIIGDMDENAESLVKNIIRNSPMREYQFIPAVKDYNREFEDIELEEFEFHRNIIMKELEDIQPDLVVIMGDIALKVILKQRGLLNRRGCEFVIESETTGKKIVVFPTFSPETIYLEPTVRGIFLEDLTNSYNRNILKLDKFKDSGVLLCTDMGMVREEFRKANLATKVGNDLETTGLDFKLDVITCFGCSYSEDSAFIVPMHHYESPFTDTELEEVYRLIAELHRNPKVMKLYANVKFDQKFLMEKGVTVFNNTHCIQFMHSLVDENRTHSLVSLVKEYFPEQLKDW